MQYDDKHLSVHRKATQFLDDGVDDFRNDPYKNGQLERKAVANVCDKSANSCVHGTSSWFGGPRQRCVPTVSFIYSMPKTDMDTAEATLRLHLDVIADALCEYLPRALICHNVQPYALPDTLPLPHNLPSCCLCFRWVGQRYDRQTTYADPRQSLLCTHDLLNEPPARIAHHFKPGRLVSFIRQNPRQHVTAILAAHYVMDAQYGRHDIVGFMFPYCQSFLGTDLVTRTEAICMRHGYDASVLDQTEHKNAIVAWRCCEEPPASNTYRVWYITIRRLLEQCPCEQFQLGRFAGSYPSQERLPYFLYNVFEQHV
jgi:hypothetical protein